MKLNKKLNIIMLTITNEYIIEPNRYIDTLLLLLLNILYMFSVCLNDIMY